MLVSKWDPDNPISHWLFWNTAQCKVKNGELDVVDNVVFSFDE